MKNIIKLEELGLFVLSIFCLYKLNIDIALYLYPILFFSPDIGMIGYLVNTKIGAITYNFCHHKAIGFLVVIAGIATSENYIFFAGLMFLAHSSFDRVLGYGLKYPDNFKHTSIGEL